MAGTILKSFLLAVHFVCLFDVQLKVVVVAIHGKLVGGPVGVHEFFQLGIGEAGKPPHQGFAEAVVHIFFLLLRHQPIAEALHAFVFPELKCTDQFVYVNAGAGRPHVGHGAHVGFLKIKCLGVVLAVLCRILPVVARPYFQILHHGYPHLQRQVELAQVANFGYRELHGGLAEVRKPKRIGVAYGNAVMAVGIGKSAAATRAEHTHRLQRKQPR